jgi:hypothetical protein
MGKSRKNRDKKKQNGYYDDTTQSDYSGNKSNKKSRFDGNRRDKEIQQKMFIDWDTL